MEKPPLEKIIEKLKQLDINQWRWRETDYPKPEFYAEVCGLRFYMCKYNKYHYLAVSDWENNLITEYHNRNKNSFEEKEIKSLYNSLHERLKTQKTAEFSEMLDEFLSEKTGYKTSMKEPELEKVIAKLRQLDPRQWKMSKTNYGSEFITNANGLTFCLDADIDCSKFKEPYYHKLVIKNREGNIQIKYANSKKDSSEEIGITTLYEKLRQALEKDRETKLEGLISNFLSE